MQLRWTEEAAADLERIADYLFEHAPDRAAALVRAIFDAPAALLTFPHRGRPGKKAGTRELVLSALPYIVVYTVRGDVIYIARILHGAQQWP
jgi:toxin ParE1/3/4